MSGGSPRKVSIVTTPPPAAAEEPGMERATDDGALYRAGLKSGPQVARIYLGM